MHPPRSPSRLVAHAVAALVVVGGGACGSDDAGREGTTTGTPAGRWSEQPLGTAPGPDQPVLVVADGADVVVAVVSESGRISGFATDDDGRLQPGRPTETGRDLLQLADATRTGSGWFALGSAGIEFDAVGFRSDDGRTWAPIELAGFASGSEPRAVVATGSGLVGIGTQRTATEPAQGGFRPAAWHSTDGQNWVEAELPVPAGATEGTASAVVRTDDGLLAVGSVDRQGAMWASADDGATWELAERRGIPDTLELRHVVASGETLVISAMAPPGDEQRGEGTPVVLRSTDQGHTWSDAATPPPPSRSEAFPTPIWAGGGRFFALDTSFLDAFGDPEACYADIDLCRQDSEASLYTSPDGDRWARVDTSDIARDQDTDIAVATGADDGRVVILTGAEGGVGAWSWPADVPLPTEDEPELPRSDVRILGEGDTLPPGERYGYPLYIHCGVDQLYEVNGRTWRRSDDGPDVETGAGEGGSDDWPIAQQAIFGFVTLVEDDLIEYSIAGGEVIATYVPTSAEPEVCM